MMSVKFLFDSLLFFCFMNDMECQCSDSIQWNLFLEAFQARGITFANSCICILVMCPYLFALFTV